MKIKFLYLRSSKCNWAAEAIDEYQKKIKAFISFEIEAIKSPSMSRGEKEEKKSLEAEKLLKNIDPSDLVILFDEKGKGFSDSVDFSTFLTKKFELGKAQICFVIGGPYGVADKIKQRANHTIQLSNLTMNHHVALVSSLEQIYRAFTIQKNIPYHNS